MREFQDVLEERKAASTLQVLFKVARLVNEAALTRINEERPGKIAYRPSHTALIPHLELEGSRITALAESMQVSKQAVSQVVEELEQMGVVRRVPDPADGRAKLVKLTKKGQANMLGGLALLGQLERELAEVVGQRSMTALGKTLTTLLAHIEENGL